MEACNSAMPLVLGSSVEFNSPLPMPQTPQCTSRQALSDTPAGPTNVLDSIMSPVFTEISADSQSSDASFVTARRGERRLLIIGGGHRTATCSYADTFRQLSGVLNDRNNLRSTFKPRGYSVQTMVEVEYDRTQILENIAEFLSTAIAGDVRVIVFTGHTARVGPDQRIAIIPPNCPSEGETITADVWHHTINTSAGSGVLVVSVFAACESGAILQQMQNIDIIRLTDFNRLADTQHTGDPNGPIHIALSSSGATQLSYEYFAPCRSSDPRSHDPFLWALAETVRRPNINDWGSFVETLQNIFDFVRATGFQHGGDYEFPYDLEWLLENPQTPRMAIPPRQLPVRE
jgi:hypothetical protein